MFFGPNGLDTQGIGGRGSGSCLIRPVSGRGPLRGGMARTEEQARHHLADMLLLCDPAAAVTADIVEFTRARTVAHYTGTAGDLFAQFTTGAPARTVIARRLTNDTTTPTAGQR